jgi:outer membrane protein assembly factor BamB
MAASQFIALLESRGLLDPEIIVELHRQVEQSKGRITPEAIAKLLVENGQLTRFQATKLITELNQSLSESKPDPTVALRGGRPLEPEIKPHDSVDDLLPADLIEKADNKRSEVVPIEETVEVVEVVEAVEKRPRKKKKQPDPIIEFEDIPKRVVRDSRHKKKNAWESFRILGSAFVVLLLLIVLVPLLAWLFKGSADEAWTKAEDAYKARDYEKASRFFGEFGKNHASDPRVSQSKVFVGLSNIRQAAEKATDPLVALKECQAVLPTISNESGLNELRGDVTDTLLRISEKFVAKIESTAEVSDRKSLIDKMNQQMEFVRDPRFVGTQERTQNELRIRKIEEDQNRIQRDVLRIEDFKIAVDSIAKAVAKSDVTQAYEVRRGLIRKYPQLQSDPKLGELLDEATKLQQGLVGSASAKPSVRNEAFTAEVAPSAMLVNRKVGSLDNEVGSTFYAAIKGSVVAMNSATGKIVWRHPIGRDWSGEPKRIMPTADSDVLVSVPEQGLLRRLAAADGALVWEAKFEGRLVPPLIDGDDVFVGTTKGDIFCLDVLTGQSRWAKTLPQSIDVGFGGAPTRKKRYVLGNHSNLYVISRASGQCEEVEYIGHAPSTIAVAPIWILNQLIIFENDGPDYCSMRVFTTSDDGLNLKPAQNPITLRGHVVVEPQVDGRRLAVATNLGEIAILDVDPNAPKNKVYKLVNLIENEVSPKTTWPLMFGSDLWVASSRLIYYQVQVTSQKLNRQWLREDGDQFTNRPMKVDDYVIHTRVVRGNLGVRVTAIKPSTGDVVWESDVGVPVTALAADGAGITAATAQGAIYALDDSSFTRKQAIEPVENLGRNQRSMMFVNPVVLKDSRIAFLNQAKGNQLLLIDPAKRNAPSKMLAMDLGEAYPSGEPVAIGNDGIVVPLDNAQIAMIDPEKGKMIGSPFQPSVQAGERPVWLNPVVLPDRQTVVVADQQRFMYKLSTGKQLRVITSVPLDRPLKGRMTLIQDKVVGVSANASGDQLDFYDSNELNRTVSLPVEGRFVWGPFTLQNSAGSIVLAYSDIDGLIACDEAGKLLWTRPLDKVVLVGKPSAVESDCIVATSSGSILRVASSNGSIVARVEVGESLFAAPTVLAKSLLVPCEEGLILTIPIPSTQTGNSGAN